VGLAVGAVGLAAPAGSVSGAVSDILPRHALNYKCKNLISYARGLIETQVVERTSHEDNGRNDSLSTLTVPGFSGML
jgi:hypothetical protein